MSKINAAVCLVIVIGVFCFFVSSKPVRSGLKSCEGEPCPNETYACSISTKINPNNKSQLVSDIECLGLHDEVLQNRTVVSKNPFGGNVYFQGYRYTGVYEFSSSGTNNTRPFNHRNPNAEPLDGEPDHDIEIFN